MILLCRILDFDSFSMYAIHAENILIYFGQKQQHSPNYGGMAIHF
jgi:hypothetical protein